MLLHAHDESLPHLVEMEQRGKLVFIPFGGGNVQAWTHRLAPLGKPEFHLYDHELPPESDLRREAAETVNRRPSCGAVLTRKRSLENYLHAPAIKAAGEVDVTFEDFDPAAEVVAKGLYQRGLDEKPWELLPPRARRRMANRAKRWLNTTVVGSLIWLRWAGRGLVRLLVEATPSTRKSSGCTRTGYCHRPTDHRQR